MSISPGAAGVLLFFALFVIAFGVGAGLLVMTVAKTTQSRARSKAAALRTFLNASGAAYLPAALCTGGGPFSEMRSVELWLLPGRLFLGEKGFVSEYAIDRMRQGRSLWDRPARIVDVRIHGPDVAITIVTGPHHTSVLTLHGLSDHVRAQIVGQLR